MLINRDNDEVGSIGSAEIAGSQFIFVAKSKRLGYAGDQKLSLQRPSAIKGRVGVVHTSRATIIDANVLMTQGAIPKPGDTRPTAADLVSVPQQLVRS